ncbi:MAG: DUF2891 domain-containing protein [Pseudomonadota bacterium]
MLALECVHREYPNKISHVLQSSDDALSPRELTPAFYGCYDWHSSVHGHWLLSRLLELEPEGALAEEIRVTLSISFTQENIQAELAYYLAPGRNAFERPYGIAWFLQLVAELDESSDRDAQEWREVLRPLEAEIVRRVKTWVPDLVYPIRSGTHNQTAFAFGLMIDYARQVQDRELEALLIGKSREFHLSDTQCPLHYEPSGDDFLSPCLMEADLMRRVLTRSEFSEWLHEFLPEIPDVERDDWLQPGVVLDAADVKLVHLDGLNLSRAWALEGIAAALSDEDLRRASLLASARRHREAGVSAVSGEHYAGSHWLASFATYLVTKRGFSGG